MCARVCARACASGGVCLAMALQPQHLCALLYKQWDARLCTVLLGVCITFSVFQLIFSKNRAFYQTARFTQLKKKKKKGA